MSITCQKNWTKRNVCSEECSFCSFCDLLWSWITNHFISLSFDQRCSIDTVHARVQHVHTCSDDVHSSYVIAMMIIMCYMITQITLSWRFILNESNHMTTYVDCDVWTSSSRFNVMWWPGWTLFDSTIGRCLLCSLLTQIWILLSIHFNYSN